MAKFTAAQIEEHAKKLLESFSDGFQWKDVFNVVPEAMRIVQEVSDITGPEKEESALAIVDYVIDNTDTPWLPDSLTDPIIKQGARFMIPKLIEAAKGKLKID